MSGSYLSRYHLISVRFPFLTLQYNYITFLDFCQEAISFATPVGSGSDLDSISLPLPYIIIISHFFLFVNRRSIEQIASSGGEILVLETGGPGAS